MLTYSNGFSTATSDDGSSVIINFIQVIPHITDNGQIEKTEEEIVSSIVLNLPIAKALSDTLGQITDRAKE